MSRCFPFPPPGYEKQTKSERTDLLAEAKKSTNPCNAAVIPILEKRKEKKRKKEKRGEKREGKEKKEKDRSKDKLKEKKDRKQKHKDRKEKDKDKGRNKRPYDRLDKQSQSPHGDAHGECSRKIEEIEHSKLKEELDRRIKNEEEVAAHRKVENISGPVEKTIRSIGTANAMVNRRAANDNILSTSTAVPQRKVDGLGRSTDKFIISAQRGNEGLASPSAGQKERSTSTKLDPVADKFFTSTQRRNEGLVFANVAQKAHSTSNKLAQNNDNFSASTQRRNEGLVFSNAIQKERITSDKLAPKLTCAGQIGNGGVSLPTGNSVSPLHRGLEGSLSSPPMEIDNHKINKVAYNSNNAAKRTINGMAQSAQSISVHKQNNSTGPPIKVEDREDNKSTPNHGYKVARKINGMGQSIDKGSNRNEEGTNKNERTADDSREERYSGRDHDQRKIKDKGKQNGEEKEKAKTKEKGEKQYKELKVSRDDGKKSQLHSPKPKPFALQIDSGNNKLIDDSVKKRKGTDINGFLNESSLRPNKVPRTNLSTQHHEENGRTLELSRITKAFPSLKPEGINNTPSCKAICSKQTNGVAEGQPSSADLMQPAAAESGVTSKVRIVPHPDSVYLDQIYSVPKAEEWHEDNDQEWLFSSSHHLQKPKSKLGDVEIPQVWSKAVRIEQEDLVALPYVVPF